MERITDKYVFFWGSEFSNWYESSLIYEGIAFLNSEQAFMWKKAMYFNDIESAFKIAHTPGPASAKRLGRKVKNFNSEVWLKVGYDVMVEVNFAKFSQKPLLKNVLLSTGDKIIVEASPDDVIWGIGLYWEDDKVLDESKWRGQNLLGKALMEVRTILREVENKIK